MQHEDEVRLVAYQIWEEEGSPRGRELEHWFKAEAVCHERQGQTQHVAGDLTSRTHLPTPKVAPARKQAKVAPRHSL